MRLPQASSARFRSSARVSLTAVLALVLVSGASLRSQEVSRTVIPVASQWPGSAGAWQIDISDDGRYVVYQTNRGDGWKLLLHELGQPTSREIAGLAHAREALIEVAVSCNGCGAPARVRLGVPTDGFAEALAALRAACGA